MDEEKRLARNAYMRKWNAKNRDRLNAEQREKTAKLKAEDSDGYAEFRVKGNEANARYYEKHKDEINARSKARNWNYNPEQRVEIRKRHYKKHPVRNLFRQRRKSAEKKGLPFELTEEWYWAEWELGCAVTGIEFDEHGADTPWVAHVDRIVPEDGYTQKNCRLVCASYNLAKKHWTDGDVMRMATALILASDGD